MTTSGYDAPIVDVEDDVLGRAPFANGIARLAVESPAGWGVRIGVYGRWGEGKSSVLNMVARQVRAEGHLVAEFNPWGCSAPQEMIGLLADALIKVAKESGKDVKGRAKRAARRGAGMAVKGGGVVANVIGFFRSGTVPQDAKDVGANLSPWVARWASDRKEDIGHVLAALQSGERIVVLVDDIDRVDPKLLPRLFFAMHEVFAFPGISFILSLDPDVVGAALREYHAGFRDGVEFLAKIVQFPRWLPSAFPDALRRLADRDRAAIVPFLGAEVLVQEAALLPTNPRELRAFVRALWCLKAEIDRHDDDEIDQHLLVVLEAIRQASPAMLSALLARDQLLNDGAAALVRQELRARFEASIREIAATLGPEATERAVQVTLALCGRSIRWGADHVRYHAYLAERPHAVTWREFRALLALGSDAERAAWVQSHAGKRVLSPVMVARECVSCCLGAYRRELDAASTTGSDEGNRARIAEAGRALELLDWLWFRFDLHVELRDASAFVRVVQTFRSWAHFVLNEADRTVRGRERDLLLRMASATKIPLDYLEVLAPWDPRNERHGEAAALTEAVLASIVGRAADEVMASFTRPSGVSASIFGDRTGEQWLLLHHEPMWTNERRDALRRLLATPSATLADNCRLLVEVVMDPGGHNVHVNTDPMRADQELLRLLWEGAISVAVQARFFNGLRALRAAIGEVLGDPPAVPTWWDEVERRVRGDADPAEGQSGVQHE